MAKKRSSAPKPPALVDEFFSKQLPGETPLTRTTAEVLLGLADSFERLAPWEMLDETDLLFVTDEAARQPFALCSITGGAYGEHLAFYAYLGPLAFYRFDLMQREQIRPVEFFAAQDFVRVDFVPAAELSPPDRELLKSMSYPAPPGRLRPRIRANRAHHHPWYPTEAEAQVLTVCLANFLSLFDKQGGLPDLWQSEKGFPAVRASAARQGKKEIFLIEPVNPVLRGDPLPLDGDRITRILRKGGKRQGSLEVQVFHAPAQIGPSSRRQQWLRLIACIDGETGLAFGAEAIDASADEHEAVLKTIYKAIETRVSIPRKIRVSDPLLAAALDALGKAINAEVIISTKLPALDVFRREMMRSMFGIQDPSDL